MSNGEVRTVAQDIDVGGAIAFTRGEQVVIEAVEPNPERPEYMYVVHSRIMGRHYQLRDADLLPVEQPQHFAPGDAFQQGVIAPVQYGAPPQAGPTQPYRPATVTRPMAEGESKIMWFSLGTGVLGLLVIIGTFLPWLSALGINGGSGWQAMLHGSATGGFSIVVTGLGVVFFTGFWSLAAGIAIIAGAVLLFLRRTVGGWVARIAGGVGAGCAMVTMATIYTHGLRAGVGLWFFFLFSVGAIVVGSLTMNTFR